VILDVPDIRLWIVFEPEGQKRSITVKGEVFRTSLIPAIPVGEIMAFGSILPGIFRSQKQGGHLRRIVGFDGHRSAMDNDPDFKVREEPDGFRMHGDFDKSPVPACVEGGKSANPDPGKSPGLPVEFGMKTFEEVALSACPEPG
jgi:hypothetical protein